jgi:hypothetical protein
VPGGAVVISDTPLYRSDASGRQMVAERRANFLARFGTASDSVSSREYLTPAIMRDLETAVHIRWTMHRPWYGWKWFMRPLMARLRRRRTPSRFVILSAHKRV